MRRRGIAVHRGSGEFSHLLTPCIVYFKVDFSSSIITFWKAVCVNQFRRREGEKLNPVPMTYAWLADLFAKAAAPLSLSI